MGHRRDRDPRYYHAPPASARAAAAATRRVAARRAAGPSAQVVAPEAQVVAAQEIQRVPPGEPIEKLLMGRAPGVFVSRTPDGGISVRIRGPASFYLSGEPLYVIDGTPIEPGSGGVLRGINPWDIASIQVLKNPSDTAIYGMRGANGVIVIKTKGSH